MFALTVDQVGSRTTGDRVDAAIRALGAVRDPRDRPVRPLLGFDRTIGDEFQGVLDDPLSVLTVMLHLVDDAIDAAELAPEGPRRRTRVLQHQAWHMGLGVGAIDSLDVARSPDAMGEALTHAREAVEAAKRSRTWHLCVRGPDPELAGEVEGLLHLLADLRADRTPGQRQAVHTMDSLPRGATITQATPQAGHTRQNLSKKLLAARRDDEAVLRAVAVRLLQVADESAGRTGTA